MYFKNLKTNLIPAENKKTNSDGKFMAVVKKLRQKNSVFFSVDTTGRVPEISRLFLTA